ncbi:MAG: sn-glycerol-3-phosphate ABC transporter ATP-binding protein UgpC [Hydrogenibacillus schlegelii]|nr:sn-glycerol-3-phosphate ABC transporter ATP-binding protein UgpC [Hydrogenibacillus schlegelii]
MASVVLKNVTKRYPNGFVAVKNVSLTVEDGEFVVLVGPSGCGKSTTLRMIAGLEDITEGELYIGDRLVNDVPPKDRDIAMVFQNYALYPHMTVYDNMAFGLKLRKVPKDEIRRRVHEAARILAIEHLLDRKPKALSGGQRQRVALGRAIVREPQVFLMDEPLSNLDAKLRVQMRAEIIKLHERIGATTIYVTHDQTEAMTMGDRIVVMKDGVIQQVSTPETVYNRPANLFVAGFIGSPAMNFLRGTLEDAGGILRFQAPNLSLAVPEPDAAVLRERGYAGRPIILGIRPQDIVVRGPEGLTFSGTVTVVENMGSEKYLYIAVDEATEIVARVDASLRVTPHERVTLGFPPEKLHFFDPETELAVRPPDERPATVA